MSGESENACVIIGATLRRVGWTQEQLDAFTKEATSGDYGHVLQTCMKYADVD